MSRRRNGGAAARAHGRSADARRLLHLLNALGGTTFRQLLWQKATELDLTFAQSQVLFHVAQHPGCHMGEVARAFRVTLPAVTHIVDRLEQKRLVGRAADPADRRVSVLELSATGQALVRELEGLQLGTLDRVLGRLSASERRQVLLGLTTLVNVGADVG